MRQTARTIAALGVDRVRLTAGWSAIAPSPRDRAKPGFDATNPAAYPRGAWDRLDTAVDAARAAGLKVMLDIGFWAPRWAVRKPSPNPDRQRYAPNPAMFADFATAVVRRYGAVVRLYTPWNEPNHPSFLAPQWRRGRPLSPHVYRAMYTAAYAAMRFLPHPPPRTGWLTAWRSCAGSMPRASTNGSARQQPTLGARRSMHSG